MEVVWVRPLGKSAYCLILHRLLGISLLRPLRTNTIVLGECVVLGVFALTSIEMRGKIPL